MKFHVILWVALLILSLSGCALPGYETAGTSSTTATTATTTLSVREQVPFYEWTLTEMIAYLTEERVLTDETLLTVTPAEELTGISGHFTYATADGAAVLDVFYWDPQSSDEAVAQQRIDMLAGRPLTLGGLSLTGDKRVGDFLFLYGTSADPLFADAVAAACDKLKMNTPNE